jgi:hypothetical protein
MTTTKHAQMLNMQSDFFGYKHLSVDEIQHIKIFIRNKYFFLRNLRKWSPNVKVRRKIYREIEPKKNQLLEAGFPQDELLLFLACCRGRCRLGKECKNCSAKYG